MPSEVAPPTLMPRDAPAGGPSADGRRYGLIGNGDPHWYYLVDIATNTHTPLDVGPSGEAPGTNDMPATPELTLAAGGRHVAFVGSGPKLVPGVDGSNLLFIRDVEEKTNHYVAPGTHPSISAGGRYVTFTTTSALSGQDRDERSDIYRYDARTRDFLLISESESVQDAVLASISADGCVVAWQSVSGQEGRLLVRDLRRPDDSGPPAADTVPAETNAFALSGDGRYVAYASQGSKLPPGDTIPRAEIFVFDRQTKVTDRVSISSTGDEANHGAEWWVWISPDARYVLFPSESTNLDSTDSRRGWFMRDRQEKRTWRVAKVPEPGDDPAEG